MTVYPQDKDVWRTFVEGVSDLMAHDLNRLFDLAVAIETELGLEPAGRFGTVLGRLFAKGNLSRVDGKWRRVEWTIATNVNSNVFDEGGGMYKTVLTPGRWDGTETKMGIGVPGFFLIWQAPPVVSLKKYPWYTSVFKLDETEARTWARDSGDGTTGPAVLASPNSAVVNFGILQWGVF